MGRRATLAGGHPTLSQRESEVLELIAGDLFTREIAGLLHVSDKDVEYHVGRLLQKFDCRHRAGLVSKAWALGYLATRGPEEKVHSIGAPRTNEDIKR